MKIRIYGGNKSQQKLARACSAYVLQEAFPLTQRKLNNSTLYVRFVNDVEEDYCGCAYTPADNSYVATSYTIKINLAHLKDKEELVSTLMHELVHVYQMASRNVLRYTLDRKENRYLAFWKGKMYDPDKGYSKQPWERQAYYWESKLAKSFTER